MAKRRDSERTRAALLDAALEEFATHGYAGATVRDIAARAGVSKDLIAYHFDGKEGLYRAVQEAWRAREDSFSDPGLELTALVSRYLHEALTDPRPLRLLIWRGLTGADDAPMARGGDSLAATQRRQQLGELPAELDVATLRLVLLAAVAAPIAFPESARRLLGVPPDDPRFEERYGEGLRTLLTRLVTSG